MNDLKVKAVKHYPDPGYPTREEARQDPSLLRAVPRRWRFKNAVCAALAFSMASGLCSCANEDPNSEINKQISSVTSDDGDKVAYSFPPMTPATAPDGSYAMKIPVFEHGLGRGSYGCESVAPPVFLSEEEAIQVIREEAAAQGLNFDGKKSLEAVVPVTQLYYGAEDRQPGKEKGTLELDGYNDKLGIGFEFVSQKDVSAWADTDGVWSTVESFDMKGAAELISDNNTNIAAFYDPGMDWSRYGDLDFQDWEGNQKKAEQMHEDNIALLREQVREFLAWLQAQGVI